VSITSLDHRLSRSMEPRAATPKRRLDALRQLTAAGVPTTVMFAPSIPSLNDHEMEAVLEAAAGAGATTAGYVALRLPLEIKDLFEEWLASDHPDRAKRVMSLVRQMRGGAAYSSEWGKRMTGEGPVAEVMSQRFHLARKRFGLDRRLEPLDLLQFAVPAKAGDQLSLF
jgi:DNA repair photolyase